jgi:hypothetical protein
MLHTVYLSSHLHPPQPLRWQQASIRVPSRPSDRCIVLIAEEAISFIKDTILVVDIGFDLLEMTVIVC